jgi:hypothetical protein
VTKRKRFNFTAVLNREHHDHSVKCHQIKTETLYFTDSRPAHSLHKTNPSSIKKIEHHQPSAKYNPEE